ncbi:hypothetical protein OC846_006749, partial [Tilletia horrida]
MDETDPASILSMNDPSAVATASAKASSAAERADKLANTRLLRRDREGSILLGHDEEVAPTCSTPDIEGVNHYQHAAYGGLLIIVSGYKLSHLSADFGVRIDDDDGISRRTSTSKVTQKFGAAMSAQFVVPSSDDEEDRMSWGGTYSAAPGLHEETPAFAANHEMLTARQNLPHTFPSPLHHPEPNILLSGHGRPPSPMSRPEALRTFVSAYEAMGRATRLLAEASAVLNVNPDWSQIIRSHLSETQVQSLPRTRMSTSLATDGPMGTSFTQAPPHFASVAPLARVNPPASQPRAPPLSPAVITA